MGNGGLDAVVRLAKGLAATPGARGASAAAGGVAAVSRDVQLSCLGFIHVFLVHILSKAVRTGG